MGAEQVCRQPGRTEARPIGANENPQRVEDTLWIACVSNALHHHRISDTMMMSTHPLVPRTSALTARYCSRVVDTAAVAVPEVQLLWVTPRSASERLNVGTELLRYISSFGDARLWSHRWMQIYIPWIPIFIITTDPLRGSRCWVNSVPYAKHLRC